MSFEKAIRLVLEHEGGFVNHKDDRGGATNFGITEETLGRWRRSPVNEEDVKDLTTVEAKEIYKAYYWDPIQLDSFKDEILAAIVFDQAVNRGVYRAATDLQKLVGVKADGKVGPVSLAAVNAVNPKVLALDYIKAAQLHYAKIVKNNPSQRVFIVGWIKRTHTLLDYLLI